MDHEIKSAELQPLPYHDPQEQETQLSRQWKFTDHGEESRDFSADGSVHVTDEVFNAASHLAATMLSLLGTVLLITGASAEGSPWKVVSFSIYGASLIFLFIVSTLHHSIMASPKIENWLRMMDYFAIFPLIAGTFTPICLVLLRDTVIGWSFFSVSWFLSLVGMVMTFYLHHAMPKWMSMTMYLTLGWFGALMIFWLLPELGFAGVALLALGGVLYTVGGYIYTVEKPAVIIPGKFGFHELWHVFVMLGAFSHWCLMYFYVLPYDDEPVDDTAVADLPP